MTRAQLVALVMTVAACGGSEAAPPAAPEAPKPAAPEPAAEPAPAGDSTAAADAPPPKAEPPAPIASTPLAGSIEEKPSAVKSALAEKNPHDASRMQITVFDRQVACKDLSKPGPPGSRWVTVTVPWKKEATELTSADAGIGSDTKAGPKQQNVKTARVEVVELPAKKGQKAKVRLKIESAMGDSVEGEAEVAVCE